MPWPFRPRVTQFGRTPTHLQSPANDARTRDETVPQDTEHTLGTLFGLVCPCNSPQGMADILVPLHVAVQILQGIIHNDSHLLCCAACNANRQRVLHTLPVVQNARSHCTPRYPRPRSGTRFHCWAGATEKGDQLGPRGHGLHVAIPLCPLSFSSMIGTSLPLAHMQGVRTLRRSPTDNQGQRPLYST